MTLILPAGATVTRSTTATYAAVVSDWLLQFATGAAGPFLVIGSLIIPVAEGQAVVRLERGGVSQRAFAGNLRSSWRWEKRIWSVTTGLLTSAERTALTTLVALGAQVVCSGAALGGSVLCEVLVGDGGYVTVPTDDGTNVLYTLALTVSEA